MDGAASMCYTDGSIALGGKTVLKSTPGFWQAMDQLLAHSKIAIDRPRGSQHPCYPKMVYPLDYGYLEGTSAMDGEGVDVWVGTSPVNGLDALLCVVDLPKREVEVKLLLRCTEGEKQLALQFQSQPPHMLALLVRRKETPSKKDSTESGSSQ